MIFLFFLCVSVSLCFCGNSEASLDATGEGAEVADPLDFVVGKFHTEVIFEVREEFERLEAVDPELFIEIVTGLKAGAWHLEMGGSKVQDFVRRLFNRFHGLAPITRKRER